MRQRAHGIIQVLQDIQHGDERVLLTGAEVLVKRANVYAVPMRVIRADQIDGWLYTLYFPKFGEPVEKQSISAADVQNAFSLASRSHLAEPVDDQLAAGTPPPMFLEE